MIDLLEPVYLGDGVYANCDGWNIWIWTSNGIIESDKIALEPSVLQALNDYYKRLHKVMPQATDDLRTEVARLEADRDHWKARAEAAEAIWFDPIALHANLLRTGVLTREQALHLAGATDYDTLRARIAELEARLARVPDREAVAEAIVVAAGHKWPWEANLPIEQERCLRLADAAIAAMQETRNEP